MALNRKIAFIDLSRNKVKIATIPLEWRRKFLGGRGVGAYLLSKYSFPNCDPLGSDNVVVISAGLLGGTLAAPLGCTFIMTKSPLTNLLSNVQLRGLFASEIRWAGFDHLVIVGRSNKPVYLYIYNGTVEIRDAKKVWGKNISKANEQIRKDLENSDIRMIGIGPAGENLVRFATIATDQKTISGRTGIGAVFGSKYIKAIVCRGTMDLEIKQPEEVLKCKRKSVGQIAGIKKKDINGKGKLGMNLMMRDITTSKLPDFGFASFKESNFLIKELGMDPLAVKGILNWAFALIETDNIKTIDTVFPKLNREDPAAVTEMIHDIAFRKGFGNILAKGPFRTAGLIGYSSLKYFVPVKWLIKLYSEDPSCDDFGRYLRINKDADVTGSNCFEPLDENTNPISSDETNEMISNCLGTGVDRTDDSIFGCGDFSRVIEQIQFNTGLTFDDNELKKISYRCYFIERLFNIREEVPCINDFNPDCSFDVPSRLEMPCVMWDRIDLKAFKRSVSAYYRQRRWNKTDLLKAGVFKKLEIADLWSPAKR
jgi:aldehyde:ferredoxin oxidoreductase